jgi:hypothetical protein
MWRENRLKSDPKNYSSRIRDSDVRPESPNYCCAIGAPPAVVFLLVTLFCLVVFILFNGTFRRKDSVRSGWDIDAVNSKK